MFLFPDTPGALGDTLGEVNELLDELPLDDELSLDEDELLPDGEELPLDDDELSYPCFKRSFRTYSANPGFVALAPLPFPRPFPLGSGYPPSSYRGRLDDGP